MRPSDCHAVGLRRSSCLTYYIVTQPTSNRQELLECRSTSKLFRSGCATQKKCVRESVHAVIMEWNLLPSFSVDWFTFGSSWTISKSLYRPMWSFTQVSGQRRGVSARRSAYVPAESRAIFPMHGLLCLWLPFDLSAIYPRITLHALNVENIETIQSSSRHNLSSFKRVRTPPRSCINHERISVDRTDLNTASIYKLPLRWTTFSERARWATNLSRFRRLKKLNVS